MVRYPGAAALAVGIARSVVAKRTMPANAQRLILFIMVPG
jgi:hypothetical protein